MSKTWCTGQGREVELVDFPFQSVTCPICGRAGLKAEKVQSHLSEVMGQVPKHGAKSIGPDEIPEARFKDHDWERQQEVMRNYIEYQRRNKR